MAFTNQHCIGVFEDITDPTREGKPEYMQETKDVQDMLTDKKLKHSSAALANWYWMKKKTSTSLTPVIIVFVK